VKVTSESRFAVVPEFVITADITAQAVRVYAMLARRANDEGATYPSHKSLADDTRCSVPTVKRAIRELEQIGALERLVRPADGRQTSNDYHLFVTPRGVAGDPPVRVTGDLPPRVMGDPPVMKAIRNESQRNETLMEGFDQFWSEYPRKASKATARRAFTKALRKTDLETILLGLKRAIDGEWSRRSPDKIPYPATWLNAEGWEDDGLESVVDQAIRLLEEREREEA
jgi:DNA-binding MarR family transcriptional regulator